MAKKVHLAKDQEILLDGVALLGTRDFEITQELDGVDVTPPNASGSAELPLVESASLKLQIYHLEDAQRIASKWNKFPPEPVTVSIKRAGTGKFIVRQITTSGSFGDVLSYTIELKSWPYQ